MTGALFILAAGNGANAIPFNYVEGPDLPGGPNNPAGLDLGTFDVGSNTVSGNIFRSQGDVADFFEATLLSGLQITSVSLDIALSGECTVPVIDHGYSRNLRLDGNLIANTGFSCVTGVSEPFLGILAFPLTDPGLYNFGLHNVNNAGTILDVTSYTWDIQVSRVTQAPEPTVLTLLGLGLLGLFGFTRKRQR